MGGAEMSEPSVNGVLLKTLKAEVDLGYTPSAATIIAMIEQLIALHKGEFICTKCGLRKDAEPIKADF